MKNIPELDGLRGLGAVLVVAYHWTPTYIFWAWCFVPMFFVLSGFLIGRILLEDLHKGRFSLRNFYMRRILRIWPVYYAALGAIFAYYLLTMGGAFFDTRYFIDWLMSLAYLQFTPLYFNDIGNPYAIFYFLPGMLPVWTLAVEEQFYLVLPLLMLMAVPRLGLRRVAWACACIALVGPVTRAIGFAPTLLMTQLDGLALGVLLALVTTILIRGRETGARRWAIRAYAAAIVLSLAAVTPYLILGYRETPGPHELFTDPLLWTWAGLFFFGVIGLIAEFPDNRPSAFLRTRPFVYAGSVSYALYVFHMPVLTFIKPRLYKLCGPDLHWLAAVLTVLLLWALVHASRELVERPILKLKDRFGPRRPAAAPGAHR